MKMQLFLFSCLLCITVQSPKNPPSSSFFVIAAASTQFPTAQPVTLHPALLSLNRNGRNAHSCLCLKKNNNNYAIVSG